MTKPPTLIQQQYRRADGSYMDELERVHEAAGRILDAEAALGNRMREAKKSGCTWQQIGDALGVSRQAAQQRAGG